MKRERDPGSESRQPSSLRTAVSCVPRELAVVLPLALILATGAAADWPSVRGDAALTGRADTTIPAKPKVRWTWEGSGAIAGVAVAGDRVLAADGSGALVALELESGKLVWRAELGAELEAPPTVDGDRVYVGDMDGVLHTLALADGARLWTFATEGEIHAGVTVTAECLLVGSHDATVRCLGRDGTERWKVETDNFVNAAVAAADGRAWVAGCDGYLRGISLATGKEEATVALGGYVAASPTVAAGRAVVGTFENEVLGVDLKSAQVTWRWSDPQRSFPFASSPANDGKTAWIGGRDRQVHAFDLATGTLKWSWNAGARVDASPLLAGDQLVVATERGRLVFLDAASGAERSNLELGGVLGSPAAARNLLFVGNADGLLYALGAP